MKLSDHCHAVLGFATVPPWTVNAGIIVGSSRTLVVDTGPSLSAAHTLYGYASALRPTNPIVALNTEPHLDHLGGNAFFSEKGIDIYGHPEIRRTNDDLRDVVKAYNDCIPDPMRRNLREGEIVFQNTTIINPNIPIAEGGNLDLGEIVVKFVMTPGHTPANASVLVPEEGILFCGDCIVSRYMPNLSGGIVADRSEWSASLDTIRSLRPRVIVPGHGQVLFGEAIGDEIRRIRDVLRKAVRSGRFIVE